MHAEGTSILQLIGCPLNVFTITSGGYIDCGENLQPNKVNILPSDVETRDFPLPYPSPQNINYTYLKVRHMFDHCRQPLAVTEV